MPSDKLTELGKKKSKSGIKEKKLYDGQGLYLLLHPNSSKYWKVKYRFLGKEKVLALGVWPKVVSSGILSQPAARHKIWSFQTVTIELTRT